MSKLVFRVEEAPEGGWTARAVGESIFTEGDSFEGEREAVRDAVLCHFEEAARPREIRLHTARERLTL